MYERESTPINPLLLGGGTFVSLAGALLFRALGLPSFDALWFCWTFLTGVRI
jgi:hypothetical protein